VEALLFYGGGSLTLFHGLLFIRGFMSIDRYRDPKPIVMDGLRSDSKVSKRYRAR
jgi:hypothetical protein